MCSVGKSEETGISAICEITSSAIDESSVFISAHDVHAIKQMHIVAKTVSILWALFIQWHLVHLISHSVPWFSEYSIEHPLE